MRGYLSRLIWESPPKRFLRAVTSCEAAASEAEKYTARRPMGTKRPPYSSVPCPPNKLAASMYRYSVLRKKVPASGLARLHNREITCFVLPSNVKQAAPPANV